ncbi:MAG: ribulose-phosphate 3-epimerase [Alphaproteobacteria bacterium]|nr:ribulose-phosphate 3-epimerase [Alphaproteobacteria bacterium]
MVLIAPSLLSSDFSILKEEVVALEKAGADMIHLDVMDGRFVENLTFGAPVVKSIRGATKLPFDAHLMVENPELMVESFAKAGADFITVHAEATTHLDRVLQKIKSLGAKAGVALNPSTDESAIKYVLDRLDLVLVMSVNPGFGGQSFIQSSLEKIARIKKMVKGYPIMVEVDGGINPLTAAASIAAGADILVAGSAVFKTGDYRQNIKALR